jgi:hypothetical protein
MIDVAGAEGRGVSTFSVRKGFYMTQTPSLSGSVGHESGEDATKVVKENVADVAGGAKQGIAEVAHETTVQAREVTNKAKDHARELVGQAMSEVRSHADDQAQRAAGGLDQLASRFQALLAGRPEDAGPLRDYAEQLGDQAQRAAERLRARGVDGVLTDVKAFARRRPGLFLAGAAAAGFAVGRLAKAERSDSTSDTSSSGRYTGGMGHNGGHEPVSGAAAPDPLAIQAYAAPGLEEYPTGAITPAPGSPSEIPVSPERERAL